MLGSMFKALLLITHLACLLILLCNLITLFNFIYARISLQALHLLSVKSTWYTYESDFTLYSAGLSKVTLFATYLFNEGSGNRITNYADNQYPAYLGSSTSPYFDLTNSPQRLTTVNLGIELTISQIHRKQGLNLRQQTNM